LTLMVLGRRGLDHVPTRSLLVADQSKRPHPCILTGKMPWQGQDMGRFDWSSGLTRDRFGGIEGLPLQLLIMVVVAGLGLTIIMGWMNSIAAPHSIGEILVSPSEILVYDDDGDGIYTRTGILMTVTVTDEKGDRLEGATVLLEGANVRTASGGGVRGVTDSHGQVLFTDLSVEHFGARLTTITVTVAKGDYGIDSSYEVPVIPG